MKEVEQKYRVASCDGLRAALERGGWELSGAVSHWDTYFAHPARDFRETGEAFRIRSERDGERRVVRFTYKGPKEPAGVKVREEIEFPVSADFDTAAVLWERLGFVAVRTVRKRRRAYRHSDSRATVCSDQVDGLGDFAEIEIVTDDDSSDGPAREVERVAAALGLIEVEPRSYLRLVMEKDAIGRDD